MSEISRINFNQSITSNVSVQAKKAIPVLDGDENEKPATDQVNIDTDRYNELSLTDTRIIEDRAKQLPSERIGYKANFLSEDTEVPLPKFTDSLKGKVLDYTGKGESIRDYTHYSLAMHKDRKLCIFTAHNIDGAKMQSKIPREKWMIDNKIGEKNQHGNQLYSNNAFDRGHMVRRIAVAWGDSWEEGKMGSDDTMYYTNSTPQHYKLNQKPWLSLEDWLLERADGDDRKVAVFTGPVFREDDIVYRGVKIPADFWKIIVLKRKEDGELAACAFMMSQKDLIKNPKELEKREKLPYDGQAKVPTSAVSPYQVSLSKIEELTGLDFGGLKEVDAYSIYKAKQNADSGPESLFKSTKDKQGMEMGFILHDQVSESEKPHYILGKEDIIF